MPFSKDKKEQKLAPKKKKFKPTIFVILPALLLLVIIISWIVYWATGANPAGQFHPAGILELFTVPLRGFVKSAELIIFLFMLSAFLKVVNSSRALDAGIGAIFTKFKNKQNLLIIILFLVFMLCGTTFAFCEAGLAFYPLLIPILLASGFDSYTALLVICFGAGIGVLASTINPVLINTAFDSSNEGISSIWLDSWGTRPELSTSMGLIWRIVSLIVLTSFVLGYILWYTKRIKADPSKSLVYDKYDELKKKFSFDADAIPPLTKKRKIVLTFFCLVFVMLIIGAVPWDKLTGLNGFEMLGIWLAKYFPYFAGQTSGDGAASAIKDIGSWSIFEMGFLFFIGAFICALVDWEDDKKFTNLIFEGARDFVPVAFILSLASGFGILLGETGIQTVLVASIAAVKNAVPTILLPTILFGLFFLISIFIPSQSGFGRTVCPVAAPALMRTPSARQTMTAYMLNGSGMTISGSILTFSMANGLVCLTIPTSGVFAIATEMCDVPLGRFYKKAWMLYIGIAVLSIILLTVGALISKITPENAYPIF